MNHLDNILLYFTFSLLIAIAAVVYSNFLIQPDEIFGGIFKYLNLWFKTDERKARGKDVHPIFKMIMYCDRCVSGQLALWIYFIYAWPSYREGYFGLVIPHLLFPNLTIFMVMIISKFYKKQFE